MSPATTQSAPVASQVWPLVESIVTSGCSRRSVPGSRSRPAAACWAAACACARTPRLDQGGVFRSAAVVTENTSQLVLHVELPHLPGAGPRGLAAAERVPGGQPEVERAVRQGRDAAGPTGQPAGPRRHACRALGGSVPAGTEGGRERRGCGPFAAGGGRARLLTTHRPPLGPRGLAWHGWPNAHWANAVRSVPPLLIWAPGFPR